VVELDVHIKVKKKKKKRKKEIWIIHIFLLYPQNFDIESVVSLQFYISVHSLSVIWLGM